MNERAKKELIQLLAKSIEERQISIEQAKQSLLSLVKTIEQKKAVMALDLDRLMHCPDDEIIHEVFCILYPDAPECQD